MRKFKHEQTGIEIFESCAEGFYRYFGNKQNFIPKEIVENSKDWVEIFEPKFKNGNVVKNNYGAIYLITDYAKGYGYGFNACGDWLVSKSLIFDSSVNGLKLATQEEWLEALTKGVKKRYKAGDVLICMFNGNKKQVTCLGITYESSLNILWVDGVCVMKNGIWAEVLKEETLEELAESFRTGYTFIEKPLIDYFKIFFTENKETIHRLTKLIINNK